MKYKIITVVLLIGLLVSSFSAGAATECVKGDVNRDGKVDENDINRFVQLFDFDPHDIFDEYLSVADINGDGYLTTDDYYKFINFGDINDDGVIDSKDYIAARLHILGIKPLDSMEKRRADVYEDGTGAINSSDYIALRRHILGFTDIFDTGVYNIIGSVICGYKDSELDKIDQTVIEIPAKVGNFVIKGIGMFSFRDQREAKSLVIHEGIQYIDEYAFENCEKLETVSFPSTLDSIRRSFGLNNVENCYLPDNITSFSYGGSFIGRHIYVKKGSVTLETITIDCDFMLPRITVID